MTPGKKSAGGEGKKGASGKKDAGPGAEFKPALRPRRWLFVVLLVMFGGWIVTLLVMFVTTVYPHPELDVHRRRATTESLIR